MNLGQLAKRAHFEKEYFIVEKDGVPLIGIMDADEMEDYLEVRDPQVRRFIRQSHQQYSDGKHRPARKLLAELRRQNTSKSRKKRSRRKA